MVRFKGFLWSQGTLIGLKKEALKGLISGQSPREC